MARRRGRRPRKDRRRNKNGRTWAILAGIGVIVVAFTIFYATRPPTVVINATTLCPEDPRMIPHIEVLLFERNRRVDYETGEFVPLSPNTAKEIRRLIEKQLDLVPKHGLVEIYEVNYTRSEQYEPVTSFCNPGDGSELSELTGNPRLAAQRYRKEFREPFREIVNRLSTWSPDHRYSLMDTLGGVARLVLGNPRYKHTSKALTIISDFIVPQNFAAGNGIASSWGQVSTASNASTFADFSDSGGVRYDFSNADVSLIVNRIAYVQIPDIQGPAHIAWWESFFDAQNATVQEVSCVGEW